MSALQVAPQKEPLTPPSMQRASWAPSIWQSTFWLQGLQTLPQRGAQMLTPAVALGTHCWSGSGQVPEQVAAQNVPLGVSRHTPDPVHWAALVHAQPAPPGQAGAMTRSGLTSMVVGTSFVVTSAPGS